MLESFKQFYQLMSREKTEKIQTLVEEYFDNSMTVVSSLILTPEAQAQLAHKSPTPRLANSPLPLKIQASTSRNTSCLLVEEMSQLIRRCTYEKNSTSKMV